MIDLTQQAKIITKHQDRIKSVLDLMHKKQDILEKSSYDFCFHTDTPRVTFKVHDNFSSDLHKARKFMADLLGSWQDSLRQIWHSYGQTVYVSWEDPNHRLQLWLETTIEDFPEELKKDSSCRFVQSVETNYRFVCGVAQ